MHVGGCVCDLSKCQPRIPPVLFRALLALRALCIINYKQQWGSQGLLNMKLCHTVCVHRIWRISIVLFLFKKIWRTSVLFWGSLIPPFWTSCDVYSGFQSQGGFLACMLPCLGAMDSSDSLLVQNRHTSWWPAWRPSLFYPHTLHIISSINGTRNRVPVCGTVYTVWAMSAWLDYLALCFDINCILNELPLRLRQ